MNRDTYIKTTGTIFIIVALVHLSRIIFGWEIVLNGYSLPLWISWIGVLIAGFLAYAGWIAGRN